MENLLYPAQRRAAIAALLFCVVLFCIPILGFDQTNQKTGIEKDDYVMLLHGLARSNRSMVRIETNLSDYGFRVINLNYPSTEHPIDYLANTVLRNVIARCPKNSKTKIHFVTHSLGGIIVRYYLKNHKLSNLGRVVMISPPNNGSELVDSFKDSYFYKKRHGPAGQQLGTTKESIPQNLGPVEFDLGVITGNRSFNPVSSMIIPGPDDGAVSVESAKVKGMIDFIVMPNSHTFIMKSKDVIMQIIHFLEYGEFNHPKPKKE
jgi:hypothetical protein